MKTNIITLTCISICLFLSFYATAQPAGPTEPAPFGFVEVLLGAGALLGGKKLHDAKKKKEV